MPPLMTGWPSGLKRLVGENFAAVALAGSPDFGGDGLAGQHGTGEAHAQTLQTSRVTGA